MAIQSGAILTDANGFVLDRLQSAGPGSLNMTETKIKELGNWNSLATVRDTPDLTWEAESFDVTSELEAVLLGKPGAAYPGTAAGGSEVSGVVGLNEIDFKDAMPIDIISPFKSDRNKYTIFKGLVVPYLTMERFSWRAGVGQNVSKNFTMRGDTIIYTQGQPYHFEDNFTGGSVSTYTLPRTGVKYVEGSDDLYAYSAMVWNTTTGAYRRLFFDATESSAGTGYWNTDAVTIKVGGSTELNGYNRIRFTYASTTGVDYTQTGNNPSGNKVHETASTKPAAVRGYNVDVFVGTTAATPTFTKLSSVQTAEFNWSVSPEKDEELGNPRAVAQEYDTPEVSGTLGVKPFDTADLWAKLAMITGVDPSESIGPNSSVPVPLEVQVRHDNGTVLQTVYVPDARFTPPGINAQVEQKLEVDFTFNSDGGELFVYNGKRRP